MINKYYFILQFEYFIGKCTTLRNKNTYFKFIVSLWWGMDFYIFFVLF